MAYILLEAHEPGELTEKVNELIGQGWVLYGQTFVSNAVGTDPDNEDCLLTKYLQAMITGYNRDLTA